jgi:hypothetical protein
MAAGRVPGLKLDRPGIALLVAIATMDFGGLDTGAVVGLIDWLCLPSDTPPPVPEWRVDRQVGCWEAAGQLHPLVAGTVSSRQRAAVTDLARTASYERYVG